MSSFSFIGKSAYNSPTSVYQRSLNRKTHSLPHTPKTHSLPSTPKICTHAYISKKNVETARSNLLNNNIEEFNYSKPVVTVRLPNKLHVIPLPQNFIPPKSPRARKPTYTVNSINFANEQIRNLKKEKNEMDLTVTKFKHDVENLKLEIYGLKMENMRFKKINNTSDSDIKKENAIFMQKIEDITADNKYLLDSLNESQSRFLIVVSLLPQTIPGAERYNKSYTNTEWKRKQKEILDAFS
jgi:hypothetical protein